MRNAARIVLALTLAGVLGAATASAAPTSRLERTLIPELTSTYYLGTTTPAVSSWKGIVTDQLCLTADTCRTTWPTGGTGSVTQVNTTYPVLGGPITSTGTLSLAFGTTTSNTWGGTQTFTNSPILGALTGLIYGNSGTLASAATSTLSLSTGLTVAGGSLGFQVGGSNVTIKLADTAVTPGSYTNANITVDQQGRLTSASSGTGGSGTGLATTTPWTIGSVAYVTDNGHVSSAATSTLTATSPLTGSFTHVGTTGALGCQTASESQAGCLAAANFTAFSNKLSTDPNWLVSGGFLSPTTTIPIAITSTATSTISGALGVGVTTVQTKIEANGIIRADRPGVPTQYLQIDGGNASGQTFQAVGANKQFSLASLDNQATAGSNNGILFTLGTTIAPVVYMQLSASGLYLGGPAGIPSKSILDVPGNVSIGAAYAGVTAAPTNGMIVQGNTGIGTSSPADALDVSSSGSTIANFFTSAAANNAAGTRITNTNGQVGDFAVTNFGIGLTTTIARFGMALTSLSGIGQGDLFFSTRNTTSLAERMRLTSNGLLGIGTSTPSSLLNVYGADSGTTVTSASVAMADITNSDTTANNFSDLAFSGVDTTGVSTVDSKVVGLHISHTGSNGQTGALLFLTKNASTALAERFRITEAGNALISTNGNFLEFRRNTGSAIINVLGITGGTDVVRLGAANSTTGSPSFQFVNTGAVPLETITGEGNFGIGTTTPGTLLSVGNATTGTGINFSLATSTFTNVGGINLTTGCYAMNGVCLSTGGSSLTGTTGQVAYFSGTNTAVGTSTIFITPAGNVGIGTVTPTDLNANARLTVSGISSQDIIASTTDNTTLSDAILQTYAPGSRTFIGSHGTNQVSTRYGLTLGGWSEIGAFNSTFGTSNGLIIGTNPATPIVLGTNNLERMRITSAGLVGVGSTTPGSLFAIGGNGTGWNFYDNATSTKNGVGGINLSQGCFAINNVCLTSGTGTVTSVTLATPNSSLTLGGTNPVTTSGTINADLNLANPNTWTVLQRFSQASTTQLSVFNQAFFGATATSTFSSTGALTLASALAATSGGTGTATYTTGDTLYASGSNTLSKLSIGTTGQVLTIAGGVPTWATLAANHLLSATSTIPEPGVVGPIASSTLYSAIVPANTLSTSNIVKVTMYVDVNIPTGNLVNVDFAYGNATSTYQISALGTNINGFGTFEFLIMGSGGTSSQTLLLHSNITSSGTSVKGWAINQTSAATVNSTAAQQVTVVAKSNNTNGSFGVSAATMEVLR